MNDLAHVAEQLCKAGRRLDARGLVAGMEGNISVRMGADRVLCSPTMRNKGQLTPEDLCEIDLDGRQVAGVRRASSEMPMHLAIYRAAPRVSAVVHAHPPYATTFAVLGESVPTAYLPEAAIFFGAVPLAPYATTGSPAMGDTLTPLVADHTAALLQNHGAVTWAETLDVALAYMESLEAICRVIYQARLLGTPREIPPEQRAALAEIRRRIRGC